MVLKNQVSLKSGETIKAKRLMDRVALECGHKIKSFRADNMPFYSAEFRAELELHNQSIDFSGVGAHHQNGAAKRAIQTVTQWARCLMLHAIIHWPDAADLKLWPFALEQAIYLWNHLPHGDTFLSPYELFSGTKQQHYNVLQRTHVWGCPVYVLDPKLQDGKKLPKWEPKSRRGQFLGQSPEHSSTIGRILNLKTGRISPQYHVVYDDLFTTVPNADAGGLLDMPAFDAHSWEQLLMTGSHKRHLDSIEFDHDH